MLAENAARLKQAGLTRINISIDSLDAKKISRTDRRGIECRAGRYRRSAQGRALPVKLNMVLIKGVNDEEVDDLIALAKERPLARQDHRIDAYGGVGAGSLAGGE
jgi:cyclic pyranopterin phosphate synthase